MSSAGLDPDSPDAQQALRRIAEDAARAGGRVARQRFGAELDVRLKADRSEVTGADEAAQAAVVASIQAGRPADAFIAEEPLAPPAGRAPPPAPTSDAICWVIDPIDGTRNYVRRIPLYVCSVAAMLGGKPLVGTIYDPERDVLYSGSRAEGLFVNGRARAPQPEARGLDPRPIVAIPSTPTGTVAALTRDWLARFINRNLGSTALHLALVAGGELDAMLADNSRLWDVAAGWLLVTLAGGQVTTPTGEPLFPLDVQTYASEELPVIATGAARRVRVPHPSGVVPVYRPPSQGGLQGGSA